MNQFVTHSGLVDRNRLGRQSGLQTVCTKGPRRYADERRDRPEKQESSMHASTCSPAGRRASPELALFGPDTYIGQAP